MTESQFLSALDRRAHQVQEFVDQRLTAEPAPGEHVRPERLVKAMRHAVFNGGKRIRPFLLLETNALLDGRDQQAMGAAAALECVHCYSLVHDDLPAMDDDDLRRGQPTVHKAFDEATAILAGDGLLTLAFDFVVSSSDDLPASTRVALTLGLARAAGLGGMAGGQILDLAFEHGDVDPAQIETIHAMKTGALIRFACEAGAIVAGSTERAAMARFGEVLGLAFQLADDLLDVTADTVAMGKVTGKDEAAGKQTLVRLHGVDWARSRLDAYAVEATDLLAPFGARADVLRQAADFIVHRSS